VCEGLCRLGLPAYSLARQILVDATYADSTSHLTNSHVRQS
jgi:hypothetical protein